MPFDVLRECTLSGPALPEPFVRFELEKELARLGLLPKTTGAEGQTLKESWESYRRKLVQLAVRGLSLRVRNHVLDPLVERLGFDRLEPADAVQTREGLESGGDLFIADSGVRLRVFAAERETDLDAPTRRGAAYRYSHVQSAKRVLLSCGERIALVTNGVELRILLSDPARPDSQVIIPIDPNWKRSRQVPDTYRLLLALASPKGIAKLSEIVEKARLQQVRVTKELRKQARAAVEGNENGGNRQRGFIQEVLDHPRNKEWLARHPDQKALARDLWREALVLVYRLLFILKAESSDDPARAFSFSSSSLWRNTFSPSVALAPYARDLLEKHIETGELLEGGLRAVFRMFSEGLESSELNVRPLGGALFGAAAMPILDKLCWGERAVAHLLYSLLWTKKNKTESPERVHYGPLDVEDLGRVYEALLELDPGIATEAMCRLRRQKLEVVVPLAQGEKHREVQRQESPDGDPGDVEEEADDAAAETEERGKKAQIEWIEEIPTGRFFLRVGLGRKATGSYYTPHSFVRFLVQETLGPQVAESSPPENPRPAEILKLKVLDPAMGSGHFLVEACRYLGASLYEACRKCDEVALSAEKRAQTAKPDAERSAAQLVANDYRQRLRELPDPDLELLKYLPSHAPEGQESGISQPRAEAICRRLVAVHCLYGADKNPLAIELAKLSLWIESHAEGLPLTFLDHRLVTGDSLTGPFFAQLLTYPGANQSLDDLFTVGLSAQFTNALGNILVQVGDLESTLGITVSEIEAKRTAKTNLDRALAPFKIVAAAWAGGVMMGMEHCDDRGYLQLVREVAETSELPKKLEGDKRLLRMIACGLGVDAVPTEREELLALLDSGKCVPAVPYDLGFAEVFFPTGKQEERSGFDAVIGNPPWEGIDTSNKEFYAGVNISVLDLEEPDEIAAVIKGLRAREDVETSRQLYDGQVDAYKRCARRYFPHVNKSSDGASAATPDMYQCFAERSVQLAAGCGMVGLVLPSAFHSNEGATGLRQLFLQELRLQCCYSFENRKRLFEIHSSFKFATVVARRGASTDEFLCGFYRHDDNWLHATDKGEALLRYTPQFLRDTTGDFLNFLELRSRQAVPIAQTMYRTRAGTFGELRRAWGIFPTEELHTSKQRHRSRPLDELIPHKYGDPRLSTMSIAKRDVFLVCKGEHFHHFDPLWGEAPVVGTTRALMRGKEVRLRAAQFFRLAFRQQASSTNERTLISFIAPPGILFFHSALPERDPHGRPTWKALALVAFCNSFTFDWMIRQLVSVNITFNFVDGAPVPSLDAVHLFLAHSALRLSCRHAGYAPLWSEQLAGTWREKTEAFTWPVIACEDARWSVRAAMDAVIADVYGLPRDQYDELLRSFNHKSYPLARELCLDRFDELKKTGSEAFRRKYDPYWDIPLKDTLPSPLVDQPTPATVAGELQAGETAPLFGRVRTAAPQPALQASAPPGIVVSAADKTEPPAQDELILGRLRSLIQERGEVTSAEAQVALGLAADALRPLLRRLVDDGIALVEGRARGTRYRLVRQS